MQLKATGVRWQKLQKDTERNEGGGVHVRMCESCWRMLMRFLHKAKIHESLISQKLVHYLTPFPRDSRWASSYPGLLYPRHDLSTCHISYMRKIKKQGSEFTPPDPRSWANQPTLRSRLNLQNRSVEPSLPKKGLVQNQTSPCALYKRM